MKLVLTIIFTTMMLSSFSQKSMLHDMDIQETIKKGLDKTYNFEFEEAKKIYNEVKINYPDHPAYDFLIAGNLYWEMSYFDNYKEKSGEYFSYLEKSIKLASHFLEKNPKDVEGIFFTMAGESSLALYYAERDEDMKALGHVKKAYSYLKEGFVLKEKFTDFYFSTGLYDYFVIQYPEVHPVYKPFMFLFVKGNKLRGIQEMEYASTNGIFSKTECLHYLTNIFLKYEDNPEKALTFSYELVRKYPQNFYFITRHVEGLIASGKYKEAEIYSYKLYKTGRKPFIMRSYVFYGMLNEKYFKNEEEAMKYYNAALKLAHDLTQPIGDFYSFIYAGMARIYFHRGDTQKAVEYYKKAQTYGEYKWVKKEADEFLKKYD